MLFRRILLAALEEGRFILAEETDIDKVARLLPSPVGHPFAAQQHAQTEGRWYFHAPDYRQPAILSEMTITHAVDRTA